MKHLLTTILIVMTLTNCTNSAPDAPNQQSQVTEATITQTIDTLKERHPAADASAIERGVRHASSLWWPEDGNDEAFRTYCSENFIADAAERQLVFEKLSRHFETLWGHFNKISLHLQAPMHLKYGDVLPIDAQFAGFDAGAHLQDDLYSNKVAFYVALNFPYYSLEEKVAMGQEWSRAQWAYARLGDVFTARVPARLQQAYAQVSAQSELYISSYNIQAGQLLTDDGRTLFPEDMSLLSHWNLRDELKANYPLGEAGLEKQHMIYKVMQHIIHQTIPEVVINNPAYQWAPDANKVTQNGKQVDWSREPDTRYQQIINNFNALRQMDAYSPLDTYIRRNFEGSMEIAQPEVEALFVEFLSSDLLKEAGGLIAQRLGRPLEPFDIWYDGFKARSSINEDVLSQKIRPLYPDAEAFGKDIANILVRLGYEPKRATYLAEKISVEPARGSGHAWGAAMRGMQSYLRTRVPDDGMDYKGYNIAMHELGHNVEQTISLYDMDHYLLNGVPNTAFTEALAFIYQKRDLDVLGMPSTNPQEEALRTLDLIWSTYEIMGVSLLDMRVWKWLYDHPDASAAQLKATTVRLANEIWNDYYAPVYGSHDQPILAVYSHMISYPLYLSAYAYGNIIEFQLEDHLSSRNFAQETDRIYQIGRLTPNHWMQQAVGSNMDIQPMLQAGRKALITVH
ncbi:MAG: hypothetical protein LC643_05730 [Bacteroidales bacterium]|nr:hypothetical protein [Bacteroidales bacterium]